MESNVIYGSNMWIPTFFFFLFCITRASLYLIVQAKTSLKLFEDQDLI